MNGDFYRSPDLDGMRFSQPLRNALVSKPIMTQHKYAFKLAILQSIEAVVLFFP